MHTSFDSRRYLIPFRSVLLPQIFTDVLVIGSGVAGLRAALAAADHADVIVLAKDALEQTNTAWAQGGIAVVLDGDDSVDAHVRDTLTAGADLCDEPTVRRVLADAAERIRELLSMGIHLDRADDDSLQLGREGGHSAARIVHAYGDSTGRELSRTLIGQVHAADRIRLFDECFALDLITDSQAAPRCLGAITHHPKFGLQMIWAKVTILATGGCGQLYRETTNSPIATGDGMAMAYRAGAALSDLAFMQFHPTTLYVAGAERALITEAVRGEGAYLIDRSGHRFMTGVHEMAELAPRDIVARSIQHRLAVTGTTHVYLDARHIGGERFGQRFPGITSLLRRFGIDPGQDLIPIRPAAHYMVGGVWADADGRTTLPGLYACGEVACTGLHGANRLASNSLLEGLVCGEIAGRACAGEVGEAVTLPVKIVSDIPLSDRSEFDVADVRSSLRSVMWRHVGIEREGDRLAEVAEMCDFWARYTLDKIFDDRVGWEVQNLLLAGALVTRAAGWRNESRGVHFRKDHPQPDPDYRVHDRWQRGDADPQTCPVIDAEPASAR